jgi:hypothetical protein
MKCLPDPKCWLEPASQTLDGWFGDLDDGNHFYEFQ